MRQTYGGKDVYQMLIDIVKYEEDDKGSLVFRVIDDRTGGVLGLPPPGILAHMIEIAKKLAASSFLANRQHVLVVPKTVSTSYSFLPRPKVLDTRRQSPSYT